MTPDILAIPSSIAAALDALPAVTTSAIPTREIMWNLPPFWSSVVMYALFAASVVIGAAGVVRRMEVWSSGTPADDHLGNWIARWKDLWEGAIAQRTVVRERAAAIAHSLIYYGFLVLLFTTTMVMVDHDFGIRIYHGDFYLGITVLSDLLGFGALIGTLLLIHRRYLSRPDYLHTNRTDAFMLWMIVALIIQGFILEGLRINVTDDPWAWYSPIGYATGQFFWPLSDDHQRILHFSMWWIHAISFFATLALLPYTKFFHVITSPANLYFTKSTRPAGALSFPGDIEKLVEKGEEFAIGTSTLKNYSWKKLLDLDACTSCGRCQDNCPAYLSGKPLSPKWLILDSRNHMLALQAKGAIAQNSILPPFLVWLDQKILGGFFLGGLGITPNADGQTTVPTASRGANTAIHQTVRALGGSIDDTISGTVMDPNVFWSCTTCRACVEVCPVGINHVDHIIENRRDMAIMRGEIPHEAQKTLRSLESLQNPYGDQADRTKWIGDLAVKILNPGDSVDYLYWVGCVSSFDPRKQKIARAMCQLMERAGLSFGILGTSENCTGDPARRLGEENIYQALAKMNIETLKQVRFKYLVANCPHCFNTIKNEYPQLGNLSDGAQPEIIHHTVLLKRLLDEQKLVLKDDGSLVPTTFHDPCYLGRYNQEYDAPRQVLQKSSRLPILEMDRSREKGMCCGAGGGHFWMDLKMGTRVNALRVDQAAATGAQRVATGCPFCMQMMDDGVKLTNREGSLEVIDIAEALLERVE